MKRTPADQAPEESEESWQAAEAMHRPKPEQSTSLPEEDGFEKWWKENVAELVSTLEGEDNMDTHAYPPSGA